MKLCDKMDQCYSTVILAGGNSNRMGFPKPWLIIDNSTFLEKIVRTYRNVGITNIVVVINQLFSSGKWKDNIKLIEEYATIIENQDANNGRLYSIKLGLENASDSTYSFIYNVDNPFVSESILKELQLNVLSNGVTIPSFNNKGGHPVIINKSVKEEIINNYKNYTTLKNVFSGYEKRYVNVKNHSVLTNINTKEDYISFFPDPKI